MGIHEDWMIKAMSLAREGEGMTRPNPPVGALVVNNGKLVGKGYHQRAGGPHAEVIALKDAGGAADGGTLYVTLEPCSTFGKTPPCTQVIIRHGIQRVVVATRDPNPMHRGRGLSILRKSGVNVIEGVCSDQAQRLIRPFSKWVITGCPYLTLKLGMSLDGKIADLHGCSRWITGSDSRRMVQSLRRAADAILVGADTVCMDDPSLLPKPSGRRKPFRIVVDARGRVPVSAQVLTDHARHQTIMVTTKLCSIRRRRSWLAQGAQVWIVRGTSKGVSLTDLSRKLGKHDILHVLCEGGSQVASELIRAKLVDEYRFFIAPRIMGGKKAVSAVGGSGWRLESSPMLVFTECCYLGNDIMIRAEPIKRKTKDG